MFIIRSSFWMPLHVIATSIHAKMCSHRWHSLRNHWKFTLLGVVKTNWMLVLVCIKYIAFQLQIYYDKSEIDALFGLRGLIGCTAASVTTVCPEFTGSDTQTGSSCVTWLLHTTDAGCTTTTGSATHPRSRHFWNKSPYISNVNHKIWRKVKI